jgi:hypothetical protein
MSSQLECGVFRNDLVAERLMLALAHGTSAVGYERKFWGPLISVRFTPESRHTEAQCPLLGLKRTICSRVIDVGL